MTIFIHIEIFKREFDSKLLLGLLAANKGFDVCIGDKKTLKHIINFTGKFPDIYHTKSLTPRESKLKYLKYLKSNGVKITSIDEEHGLNHENYDMFANRRFSNESLSITDKVFCWGEYDFNSLKNLYPTFKEKFISTGSPRVDLWQGHFSDYWNYNFKKNNNYILIASNIGVPISNKSFADSFYLRKYSGLFKNELDELSFFKKVSEKTELLGHFVIMIEKLADRYKDIDFIIRPHPVEVEDDWRKLVKEKSNIIIRTDDSISGWINNASLLIHNGCTSGFEAAVSKIPVISYHPFKFTTINSNSNKIGVSVSNLDELSSEIEKVIYNKKDDKYQNDIIEKYFKIDNEELSSNKIVKQWERLTQNSINSSYNWKYLKILFKTLSLIPIYKDRDVYKFSKLNKIDVEKKSQYFIKKYDLKVEKMKFIGNKCFVIESEKKLIK